MTSEQLSEIWQIESNGQIIDADFRQITDLIERGDMLRMDRVRQGEMRWIEAGKVPALITVFNAKDGDEPPKPVITLTKLGAPNAPASPAIVRRRGDVGDVELTSPEESGDVSNGAVCSMHGELAAAYVCGICSSNFCKICPDSYGGAVKICPYCGAMCDALDMTETAQIQAATQAALKKGKFGFGDIIRYLRRRLL